MITHPIFRRIRKVWHSGILICSLLLLLGNSTQPIGRNRVLAVLVGLLGLVLYSILTARPTNPFANKGFKDSPFSDPGLFTYTLDGFAITSANGLCQVAWRDIQALFGYKIDLYTVDRIQLDVFLRNGVSLCLTEEMAGWHPFLNRLITHFPTIQPHWEIKIASPPFATNLTLLYERDGLYSEQAQVRYYAL